ncbi:MAG: EI24 domain-containing protein [Pseudomonadota bacterium]
MNFFSGITYNFRGLLLGIRTPKLLLLGLIRFFAMILLTILFGSLIIAHRHELLSMLWSVPESRWLIWLWYLASWLLSLLLLGASGIAGYLVSQVFFSIIIMDAMSRITEKMVTGEVVTPPKQSFFSQLFQLVKQEIPRAILPVVLLIFLLVLSWLTPIAPIVSAISSCFAVVFLAWDNTDLPSARRMVPFKQRFDFLLKTLPFHLGFGLPFLIPVLNALLLSFAPVGATLFRIDKEAGKPLNPGTGL